MSGPIKLMTNEEIAELQADCDKPGVVEFSFSDVEPLLAEVRRSRALLKSIEWSATEEEVYGDGESFTYEICPKCKARQYQGDNRINGPHKPGCELDALTNGAK